MPLESNIPVPASEPLPKAYDPLAIEEKWARLWVDEKLFRSDIRTDPSTGLIQAGIPLTLTITVINSDASCAALTGFAWRWRGVPVMFVLKHNSSSEA